MTERSGIWSALANPLVYDAFHHLIGARRWMRRFAEEVVNAPQGARVLDIGCGPAPLLAYLPTVEYYGIDRISACIKQAKHKFAGRGTFICSDVKDISNHGVPPIDIAVAIGLLHHIDDNLAVDILRRIHDMLNSGGRLITADPCFHPEQSALQRFIVGHDRGMNVRPFEQYAELCGTVFSSPEQSLEKGHFPFPYTVCVVQARRSSV